MGGWGSGRQGGRVTIEGCDSCRLAIKDLGHLLRSPDGNAVWMNYGRGGEHLLTVVVNVRPDHGYLRLQHPSRALDRAERMDYTLSLTWTVPRFGGRRWWFMCPLQPRNGGQPLRVAKLHLPPGGRYFASRGHYGLTYRSSQDNGARRALFKRLARDMGTDVAAVRRALRGFYDD
jgi:hypothetical protein